MTHDTPFGSGLIVQLIGRAGDTVHALNLFQGHVPEHIPESTLPETKRVLQILSQPYPIVDSTVTITSDKFITTYSVAKESTSSSPSGRHIGHYKAILDDPTRVDLHSQMMSIPFQVGIVPERWKKVKNIMPEKSPGDSRCH